MLKQFLTRRRTARRHRIAMHAARDAVFYGPDEPTPGDVANFAYGSTGISLTDDEARAALAAHLARYGRRLPDGI
ncbi:hypothetical protein [Streptomyces malaysiensis]|uniref:hypothetical protein n=1 Tax=Streptomyces malaysiensis TaxID=92644 RepID=UPI001650ED43|nr:hypothetical protein [Streptomyces malaysiensis]